MSRKIYLIPLLALIIVTLACGGATTVPQPAATVAQGGFGKPATLEAGQVIPTLPAGGDPGLLQTLTPQWTPQNKSEAQETIQTYARDVLGLDITVATGGGMVKDIEIPVTYEDGTALAVSLSGVSYVGVWADGMASVSLGNGSTSGDMTADLQNGSLGIFSIRVSQAAPADSDSALALIKATYPGLAGLEFITGTPSEQGFTFTYTKADDYSIRNGTVNLSGVVITAGTTAGRRQGATVVWVIVASGALTTPFE